MYDGDGPDTLSPSIKRRVSERAHLHRDGRTSQNWSPPRGSAAARRVMWKRYKKLTRRNLDDSILELLGELALIGGRRM